MLTEATNFLRLLTFIAISHIEIFAMAKMSRGKLFFTNILYKPFQAAIFIRVVKHVLTCDCFSPYLELQNGVLYHTIVILLLFEELAPHPSPLGQILKIPYLRKCH